MEQQGSVAVTHWSRLEVAAVGKLQGRTPFVAALREAKRGWVECQLKS
jgi:hypothetical protein